MELRQITDTYYVSPQITAADIPAIKSAGVTRVICNRPDSEVPPEIHAEKISEAARAHGLDFQMLPVTRDSMTPELAARQVELAADTEGRTLAYCASGTRSTMVWAMAEATLRPPGEILAMARAAGYDLSAMQPVLESLYDKRHRD